MSHSVDLWSSVELGAFLRGLVRGLADAGFQARHRFAVTEERYRAAKGRWERARVRWSSYVSYPWRLRRQLRGEKAPDAVVVCTNTFYAPAIAMQAAGGRAPVINWVFDLFPDVLVAGGKVAAGGLVESRLGDLTRATFRRAAANVFLGDRLRRYAEDRYGPIPRSHVIPVGADEDGFGSTFPGARTAGEPLSVLYCGNLGRMHDTATIASVLQQPGAGSWRVDFRGHGAGFRELAASPVDGRATFGGTLPDQAWVRAMRAADVALVTMKPGAEGLVMPSKTYSAMMAGQAILAVCPLESDLADTVRQDDAGWVVAPGDAAGLRALLAAAAADPAQVLAKRLNAFRAARRRYHPRIIAARWAELLRSVIG